MDHRRALHQPAAPNKLTCGWTTLVTRGDSGLLSRRTRQPVSDAGASACLQQRAAGLSPSITTIAIRHANRYSAGYVRRLRSGSLDFGQEPGDLGLQRL